MKINIYMCVTDDELELPVAVADTARELAKLCGTTENAVHSALSHAKHRNVTGRSIYHKVTVNERKSEVERRPAGRRKK